MKIIFLGTNGWYDTDTGNTVCTLIETKGKFIILDAGNGLYKIGKYIKTNKPIYLFLSHFHLDHIIGFHILNKFCFKQGIDVYGPPGTKDILKRFINTPYTIPVNKLKTKIRLKDLLENNSTPDFVKFRRLQHSTVCFGYRFNIDGRVVSYCTDTGICGNLLKLAWNADLLIAECSYKSNMDDKNWPHLNPHSAAEVARDSGVKRLALVHFDSGLYLTLKDRKNAEREARSIFRNTFAARDNTKLNLQ